MEIYVQNFYAHINVLKAKLHLALEDNNQALHYIQDAQKNLDQLNWHRERRMKRELARRESVSSLLNRSSIVSRDSVMTQDS